MRAALEWQGGTASRLRPSVPRCHPDARRGARIRCTATIDGRVVATGDSAPGSIYRDHCLHCAFRSRCQSGTGARGASIRSPVSDVAEERTRTDHALDANPRFWVLVSGSNFDEHQTCIGLHLTTCLVQFPGATPPLHLT